MFLRVTDMATVSWSCRLVLLISCALYLVLAPGPSGFAQEADPPTADSSATTPAAGGAGGTRFDAQGQEWARRRTVEYVTEARQKILVTDTEALQKPTASPLPSSLWDRLPPAIRDALAQARLDGVEALATALRAREVEEAERVRQVQQQLAHLKARELQAQTRLTGPSWQRWLGPEFRVWRLAWSLLFLILPIIYWHDTRNEWRRLVLNSSLPVHLSLPVNAAARLLFGAVLVLTITYLDVPVGRWLPPPIPPATSDADSDGSPRLVAAEEAYQQARDKWLETATAANQWRRTEAQAWSDCRQALVDSLVHLETVRRLADDLQSTADSLAALPEQPPGYWGGLLLAGILLATWLVGLAVILAVVQRRASAAWHVCPQCLGENKLVAAHIGGAGPRTIRRLRCTNKIEDPNTAREEECTFNFLEHYSRLRKLCFPTLGHTESGKTLWLAMTYSKLIDGDYNALVECGAVDSEEAERIRTLILEVLRDRIDVHATQTARIPGPLLFDFCDRDPWGRSHVLVNVFDYSGEVTLRNPIDHPHRQRALMADGYFYFLDPTKTSDNQAHALNNFLQHVQIVAAAHGRPFRAPVALCVSKIDLLRSKPYAGPEIDDFYQQLTDIDPTGCDMSAHVVRARSDAMGDLCNVIWPGWSIEKKVRDVFGNRFLFFPMTPLGLNDSGDNSLANRIITPSYILEPMLWLLHMNGYPVLR